MINRDFKDYLNDILDSIIKIEEFIKGLTYEQFLKDSKTQFAVVRALEIIGEASKNIPSEIKEKYAKLPWKYMSGMRDKLIHGYFGVDTEVVWKTVIIDLKPLKDQIENIISDLS
jgi:uncharacterized protein with HEPN domain